MSEVKTGIECGISLERFNDIKVGDVIEVFTIEKIVADRVDGPGHRPDRVGERIRGRRSADAPGA